MSVINLLEQIKEDEIVLPAIQREFVWTENKIEKLLDSLMRGYPIGILLLWETFDDIQFRYFDKDYKSGSSYTFHDNRNHGRIKLVLDGQQRLQSLFTTIYGCYEKKFLFFDILSGKQSEDFKENKYLFKFFTKKEADSYNESIISSLQDQDKENNNDNNGLNYYIQVKDIIDMGARELTRFKRDINNKLSLSVDDEARIDLNINILRDVLIRDDTLLKTHVIDENKPRDSEDRKSESDILEAFVRINRLGTPLSRSDLIFSMLKLNWKGSAEALPEFVRNVNKGNSFELDSDFVIRCLFAVSDLGTKFDINLLRKRSNVENIKNNFENCCNAIRSLIDFINTECRISSSKLLGGYFNLVPFVYYLFNTQNHVVSNKETDSVKKAIFLFGFSSPFSRYADSRLWKFIREELKPLNEKEDEKFPLKDAVWWVNYWEKLSNYGSPLLQGNIDLTLHLLQHRSGTKVLYEKNAPQLDHIFPRSILRKKGFDENEINHFANFWILAKNKNQNKSNKHPKDYFQDVNESILKRACIDRELLDYRRYRTFLRERENKVLKQVKKELKLTDEDYDFNSHWGDQ